MAKFQTLGHGFDVMIDVVTSQPTELMIVAYDPKLNNTVHLKRKFGEGVPLLGKKEFILRFAIEPKKLKIKVIDLKRRQKIPYKITGIQSFKGSYFSKSKTINNFLQFAKAISLKFNQLPIGSYYSLGNKFELQVVEEIVLLDQEGKPKKINTPASVFHDTGRIVVVKSEFDKMTVYNRLFILFHEFAHYHLHTKDETTCDLFAWDLCKKVGVSEYECFNSLYKAFGYIPEGSEKELRIQTLFNKIFNEHD